MQYRLRSITLFLFSVLQVFVLQAQQTPAPPQSQAIVVRGATIHIGNGQVLENAWLFFEDGRITQVLENDQASTSNLEKYQIIDATNKHIYPGFIAPHTQVGLTEIGAVRATNDNRELGYFNPSLRSILAYNTDSRITPTIRSNGILLAQLAPMGGRISGQTSIVELDAWNWEDAAYKTDEGIVLNWPNLFSEGAGNPYRKKNEKYSERIKEIEQFLERAYAYAQLPPNDIPSNLKLEAMRSLFNGEKQLYIRTNLAKSMMQAILLCAQWDIRPVIVGGAEAWKIADFLANHEIAVILHPTQSLPQLEDDDIDQPFKNPHILSQKRVLYCFSVEGAWQQRNLPFQAGQAVGFGLDYEKAVSGLTLHAAQILKIDDTVGSLEVGKDATFFISQGDALDMRSNKISHAFIRGKAINLDNKQKALYRKFSAKYK